MPGESRGALASLRRRSGWALALLLLLSACSGSEALVRQEGEAKAPWHLQEPVAFDLKMPADLFRGRLANNPQLDRCHTQGLEIIGDQVVISCTLVNPRFKSRQSFEAESLLLRAPLATIESEDAAPAWHVVTMTESVPAAEYPRITRALLAPFSEPIARFLKWLYEPETWQYMMGHPSGINYDPLLSSLWVSNAVYGRKSYSHLHQLDPQTLKPASAHQALAFRDHLGLVLALPNHLVLSSAWGDSPNFWLIDTKNKRSRILKVPTDDAAHYQDCDRLDATTFFCVGNLYSQSGFMRKRHGRLHVIAIKGSDFEELQLELRGAVPWRQTDRLETIDLGRRFYYYIEGLGDIEQGPTNRYGNFHTPVPLSNEGFAFSRDQRYVYFLPDDLPRGKLIRMRLRRTQP